MSRISGSMWAATANARRTYMPLEYRFTGVSMNLSISAKLTTASNLSATSRRAHAQDGTVEKNILAPGQFRVEARADFEQTAYSSPQFDLPGGGRGDPTENLQQRGLASTVAADDPNGFSRFDLERDVIESPMVDGCWTAAGGSLKQAPKAVRRLLRLRRRSNL